MCIYEETFAESDKTDAILVVKGKKLHVNKALLSYHSDYFKALFESDFKEKSMDEIPIKDVKFEEFATVLSLVQHNPLEIFKFNIENLFKIADRFMLNGPKQQLERFVLLSNDFSKFEKIVIADKFKLDNLVDKTAQLYATRKNFCDFHNGAGNKLSSDTKAKLFDRFTGEMFCCYEK